MTLRARLTAALLAVVLGPVLLGAVVVGSAVAEANRDRSIGRLNLAVTAVRASVGVLCQQLTTVARSITLVRDVSGRAVAAQRAVDEGLASAIQVVGLNGRIALTTAGAPAEPWADCAGGRANIATPVAVTGHVLNDDGVPHNAGGEDGGGGADPRTEDSGSAANVESSRDAAASSRDAAESSRYTAIAARVDMRDESGAWLGAVYAAQRLDLPLLRRLAEVSGAGITLLNLSGSAAPTLPAAGSPAVDTSDHTTALGAAGTPLSTEPATTAAAVLDAAESLVAGQLADLPEGRYLRRDGPSPQQPLPLAVSVPRPDQRPLNALLLAVVLLAAALAVVAASWLARSTTRPLAELARAADQVASGNLAARVPVRSPDEVGQLGITFNRMTREMQGYVHALTASRDQLRGHLGVLGDTLSSTHDLDRILEVLLQTALAATWARAGVVLLADPATGMLVGRCAEGLDERWPAAADPADGPAAVRVPIGKGLLGGVAATGEARRGRVDRDGPILYPTEPRCHTYVAVPFTAPQRRPSPVPALANCGTWPAGLPAASGVLALYDRLGQDEFDDTDLVTLRTFAGQAAVAVDNVRVHEELQRLSVTDPLTGLLNYRSLQEVLRREIERANRFGHCLGVLAIDIDRFKEVNDSYGHAAGDAVLAEFAGRIHREIREVDLAFRQGGEEFVILLPETDAFGAIVVARRLGGVVRDTPFTVTVGDRRLDITVTVSIGIAMYPDQRGFADVLQDADDALYAAKAAGRDTYRLAGGADLAPALAESGAAADHDVIAKTHQDRTAGTAAGVAAMAVAETTARITTTRAQSATGQITPGTSGQPNAGWGVAGGAQPPRQARNG